MVQLLSRCERHVLPALGTLVDRVANLDHDLYVVMKPEIESNAGLYTARRELLDNILTVAVIPKVHLGIFVFGDFDPYFRYRPLMSANSVAIFTRYCTDEQLVELETILNLDKSIRATIGKAT